MILSAQQLRDVYEALVVPMGHPDPVGYMTRALYFSGGDDEYYDADGKMGFMPVDPQRAAMMTGNQNVSTLEENVSTTVLMDLMLYEQYASIDDMIVAFHLGEEALSFDGTYSSGEQKRLLDAINNARSDVREIVSPRRATLRDVMRMLKDQLDGKYRVNPEMMRIVERIIEER